MKDKPLTYLAIPYSSDNALIREYRFQLANKIAAKLMNNGYLVFSPISHTHPIAIAGNLPKDWEYWKNFDKAYLNYCHKIIIIMAEGWKESKGVQGEIEIAKELGLEIEYIEPEDFLQ